MRVLPMGPWSVLVEDLGGDPAAWAAGLRRQALGGVVEIVPAATTVLVKCVDGVALANALDRLESVRPIDAAGSSMTHPIEVPVTYDGDDLDVVAERAGMPIEEVIAAHAAPTYVVAFCGFSPGFGYLRNLDPRLHLPRRATPRTRVPAGAVAIAAEYTAVYPRETPGGWHLLGTTQAVMFDADRARPALFEPGAHVRFVAT